MNKLWTIILRTQGKENKLELKNALNSIISQKYNNISVILTIHSNNESRIKETLSFLEPFQEVLNIKPIVIREKQGVRSYPLNIALENLDCEYVSFLDHDDIYYPNMGSCLISLMEKKNKTFAFGTSIKVFQKEVFDNWGNKYLFTKEKVKSQTKSFNRISLFLDNFIPFNTFVTKRSLINGTIFDEDLEYLEDWDFLKNLSVKEDFSCIQTNKFVSEYRIRDDNTDSYNKKNEKAWKKARAKTVKNFSDKYITLEGEELISFREEYYKTIGELENKIIRLEANPAYRYWAQIRDNKYVNKTIVKVVRKIRHLSKK